MSTFVNPAATQEAGGRFAYISIETKVETEKEAVAQVGGSEARHIAKSKLRFGLSSATPYAQTSLLTGGTAKHIWGNGVASSDRLMIDAELLQLAYRAHTRKVAIDLKLGYVRQDLSSLALGDVVSSGSKDDAPFFDDLSDLGLTAKRETLAYRAIAASGADAPFGWSIGLSGQTARYDAAGKKPPPDTDDIGLEFSYHAHFRPDLRLDLRINHLKRDTDLMEHKASQSITTRLTLQHSDNLAFRTEASLKNQDLNAMRQAWLAGLRYEPSRQTEIDFAIGTEISDDFDPQLIGRLSYHLQAMPTMVFDLHLKSEVGALRDSRVALKRAAILDINIDLAPLWSMSMDAVYAEQNLLAGGRSQSERSASVQLHRQLTEMWRISAGARQTLRDTSDSGTQSSQGVFVTLGRSWKGRF